MWLLLPMLFIAVGLNVVADQTWILGDLWSWWDGINIWLCVRGYTMRDSIGILEDDQDDVDMRWDWTMGWTEETLIWMRTTTGGIGGIGWAPTQHNSTIDDYAQF